MPSIALGVGSFKRNDGITPEVELVNWFLEPDPSSKTISRIQRPGLEHRVYLPGPINGLYQQDGIFGGSLFSVSNNQLYTVDVGTGNFTPRVQITESGLTKFAAAKTAVDLLLMVTSDGLKLWNGSNLLAIAMPNNETVVDIESLNSYFIIACSNGRFYWMEPGETTIDPLNYATAESNPDGLIAVYRRGDELRFYGTTSIEVWSATGDQDTTFRRQEGRNFDRGLLSRDTICDFDNTLVWVGDDGIVYLESESPLRISDYGIEERIRNATGPLSAFTYSLEGHLMYVLRIPGEGTFCFDAGTKIWCQYKSKNAIHWQPQVGLKMGEDIVLGSSDSGQVFVLNRTKFSDDLVVIENNDDGTTNETIQTLFIERKTTGSIVFANSRPITNANFSVSAGSSTECVLKIRWKDGNKDWTPYREVTLEQGQNVKAIYRCGSANQPIRTVEILVEDDANVVLWDLSFGDAFRR